MAHWMIWSGALHPCDRNKVKEQTSSKFLSDFCFVVMRFFVSCQRPFSIFRVDYNQPLEKVFGKTSFITSLDHPRYVACGNMFYLRRFLLQVKWNLTLIFWGVLYKYLKCTTFFCCNSVPTSIVRTSFLPAKHYVWSGDDKIIKSTFQFFSCEKCFSTTIKEKN